MSPGAQGPREPEWSEIRRDRRRGAYPLAEEALRELRRAAPGPGHRVPRSALRRWSLGLARAQPTMGPLLRLADELAALGSGTAGVAGPSLRRWVERWERRIAREQRGVVATARRELTGYRAVLTLSASSVLRRAVLERSRVRPVIRVTILRSRPGREALELARALRAGGVPVRVVADRARARAVRSAEIVLVGADAIYRDGSLLHKLGTRPLAELAGRGGIPFVVLTGGSKRLARPAPRRIPRPGWFDRTPARMISAYWTDAGVEKRPRGAPRPPTGARPGTR